MSLIGFDVCMEGQNLRIGENVQRSVLRTGERVRKTQQRNCF